ncbi:MAG: SRPBCC domain-containing protein [Sphingobacteriales bacterium]|nr:MAG: SRPBCC domain-containing protein [Sphingobacteriales bacterium]
METHDFTTTLLVDKTPHEVFDAVNQPEQWWSGEVNGNATKLNDEFTYRYQQFHFTRQSVVEMVPDKKVVWLVTESNLNYIEDKSEWTGTRIIFEITRQDKNKTLLRFTHAGLAPAIECYDACSSTWVRLLQESLLSLINTGEGRQIVLG